MTSCVALCSFEGSLERSRKASGGHGEGETPLPIPNRAVKPLSADGTWLARARESRTPPVSSSRRAPPGGALRRVAPGLLSDYRLGCSSVDDRRAGCLARRAVRCL